MPPSETVGASHLAGLNFQPRRGTVFAASEKVRRVTRPLGRAVSARIPAILCGSNMCVILAHVNTWRMAWTVLKSPIWLPV